LNRRKSFSLEALEPRELLSAVAHQMAAEVHVQSRRAPTTLTGTFSGTFTNLSPGGPEFTGSGTISGLSSPVALEGQLTGTANPRNLLFTGNLTLSNSSGSVTLSLSAHHPKFQTSYLPAAKAVVSGATGAFTGAHGAGMVNIHINQNIDGLGGTFTAKMSLTGRV
jgi:hypothetical protein